LIHDRENKEGQEFQLGQRRGGADDPGEQGDADGIAELGCGRAASRAYATYRV
jgi:hypothetical protein